MQQEGVQILSFNQTQSAYISVCPILLGSGGSDKEKSLQPTQLAKIDLDFNPLLTHEQDIKPILD